MSNYLIDTTTTIDDLFEPLQNETPNPDTNYKNNFGDDFSNSYAPYINGTTKAVITNYIVDDTTNYPLSPLDLNEIFKKKVLLPIGTIKICASSTIPTDYLLCNGQAISRTIYNDLFNLIGTTYGSGDGSLTFNIPNLNGYFPIMGPSLGSTGGSNAITLGVLPSHTHGASNLSIGNHTHSLNFWGHPNYISDTSEADNSASGFGFYRNANNASNLPSSTDSTTANLIGSVNTNNTGQATPVPILNRYIVLNYIIKT